MAFSRESRPAEPAETSTSISEEVLFDLLAAGRRRELLRYLERVGGAATLPEVTEALAVGEGLEAGASAGTYKPVYVSLYQTHIPRLVTAGVVQYDRTTATVSLTPRADPLLAHLDPQPAARQPSFFSKFFRPHADSRDTSLP